MNRLRKLLLLVLMLILPLQGLAVAYAPMHKALAQSTEAMPCHSAGHDQHAAHHAAHLTDVVPADGNSTDTSHAGSDTSHSCCHQVFTGISSRVLPAPAHKFSDVSLFVLPLFTLFIPDSPDRPPRG